MMDWLQYIYMTDRIDVFVKSLRAVTLSWMDVKEWKVWEAGGGCSN